MSLNEIGGQFAYLINYEQIITKLGDNKTTVKLKKRIMF